ncbi:hypothetical protein GL218_05031 [Daldinia childiae]|uniref:uncharacterized protein n=1 Tax=Daldinia childiae TaxID=326645 RepID=UPI001447EFEE|nr:uncharacterized protein GL218_05031 [Daldinia childiae]KAF3059798.1 hypothetical protein GL218_05031 [Daldinia childiae]
MPRIVRYCFSGDFYIHNKRVSFAPSNAQAVNDERDDVYAEIRSLWDEMVPLAHMVVEKEFLKPILGKVETCSERQTIRDATVSRYTSAILSFMNERLRLLADRIKMLAYHHQSLLGTFTHINTQELDITKRLAKNPPSGQKKGGGKVKDHTLLENIRRQMELYGPVPINFFEKAAKAELTDAELRSQLLLDSIVADSAAAGSQVGGHVYEDQQVEDSVATLKSQAEEIQTIFRQLRQDAADPPISAPEFIAYAHSQAAKQFSYKGGEGISLAKDQEQCPKFSALIHDWGDSVNFTN